MPIKLVLSDAQQSVYGLERARTFTPYGDSQSINDYLLAFTGQLLEPQTGFYLLGNGTRAYDPALMRFISADRQSPFGKGGINTYAYCVGDPVNRLDPAGEVSFKNAAKVVLLIASSGRNILTRTMGPKAIKDAAKWGMMAGELLKQFNVEAGRGLSELSVNVSLLAGAYDLLRFYYTRWAKDDAVFSPFVGPLLPETPEMSEPPVVRMEGIRRELLFD